MAATKSPTFRLGVQEAKEPYTCRAGKFDYSPFDCKLFIVNTTPCFYATNPWSLAHL